MFFLGTKRGDLGFKINGFCLGKELCLSFSYFFAVWILLYLFLFLDYLFIYGNS